MIAVVSVPVVSGSLQAHELKCTKSENINHRRSTALSLFCCSRPWPFSARRPSGLPRSPIPSPTGHPMANMEPTAGATANTTAPPMETTATRRVNSSSARPPIGEERAGGWRLRIVRGPISPRRGSTTTVPTAAPARSTGPFGAGRATGPERLRSPGIPGR